MIGFLKPKIWQVNWILRRPKNGPLFENYVNASMTNDQDIARKGRLIALVIAAGGLLAIFAPLIVTLFGLEARFEMLFLLISLAAFIWALVNGIALWRTRNSEDS